MDVLQQLVDGTTQLGMDDLRGNLGERREDERPLVQARVGDRQLLVLSDKIAIQEQVKVDGARAMAFVADAAEALLDLQEEMQQLLGTERRLDFGSGVEVGALSRGAADGGC